MTPISNQPQSAPSTQSPIREQIEWHYLPELPDDDVTCLLAHETDDTDQPTVGYHSNGRWMWENPAGRDVPAFFNVYAWAHLPANPPPRPASAPSVPSVVKGSAS